MHLYNLHFKHWDHSVPLQGGSEHLELHRVIKTAGLKLLCFNFQQSWRIWMQCDGSSLFKTVYILHRVSLCRCPMEEKSLLQRFGLYSKKKKNVFFIIFYWHNKNISWTLCLYMWPKVFCQFRLEMFLYFYSKTC